MPNFDLTQFPLFTALITPFDEQGNVAFEDLLRLLKQQEKAGNGILILGSTGEALNMTLAAKKAVLEFCVSQNLSVPIMVGVGGSLLSDILAWVAWLNTKNIDAFLMVTPLYAKPGRHGQTEWFRTLLDKAERPAVLYNIPGRTAVELHLDTVADLLAHPNFFGIKESSGSGKKFQQYYGIAKDKFMYCGDDALLPEFSALGAQGLISVAGNVWPEETNIYVRQNLAGTFKDEELWKKATSALFLASNPIPAKCLLVENNMISTTYLQPPLNAKDLSDLSAIIEQDNLIKLWFKRQA